MSLNVVIKSLNENDELISIQEIASLMKLNYGCYDNFYCLEEGKAGKYTIFYDYNKIGFGFEVSYENNSINLFLYIPSTEHDIDLFHLLIEKISKKMGVYFIQYDEEIIAVNEIASKAEMCKEISLSAINNISDNIMTDGNRCIRMYGAISPVCIGKNEVSEINRTLSGFADFLHRIQSTDSYYCNPRFYKMNDDQLRGFYFIRDNVTVTMPLKPDYPYLNIENLHSYQVQLPDDNYILYETFISNIPYAEYYDAEHITFTLSEENINNLVNKYSIDYMTLEPVKGKYWGAIIDTGYRHSDKVNRFSLNVDEINGLNHIAVFLRWANEKKFLSDELLEKCPELLSDNPDYRKTIREHYIFRDMLRTGFFKESVREFVKEFYVFRGNGYPSCVDIYAESFLGSEKYNCEEYHDEAYLFVPYDEEYYKGLSQYIEAEWKKYNK